MDLDGFHNRVVAMYTQVRTSALMFLPGSITKCIQFYRRLQSCGLCLSIRTVVSNVLLVIGVHRQHALPAIQSVESSAYMFLE